MYYGPNDQSLSFDGRRCPGCGGVALDMRDCGFPASSLEKNAECYVFGARDNPSYRCLTPKPDRTPCLWFCGMTLEAMCSLPDRPVGFVKECETLGRWWRPTYAYEVPRWCTEACRDAGLPPKSE